MQMSSICGNDCGLHFKKHFYGCCENRTDNCEKNITKVQTPVEKVPGSGSRSQSAPAHVYVGKLQAEGNTMKDATE